MKIAIIGSAPSSVKLAPYGDPSWQIWGCSPGVYYQLPRCNAFFELHRWEPGVIGRPDSQKPWFSPEYVAWLAKQPLVWIADQDAAKDLPGHKMLPWPDLVQKYGHFFFTSTIAWEMALAIEMILEHRELNPDSTEQHAIGLWGVDMNAAEEYGYQRAGCQFFCMIAADLGIEIVVPPEADLLLPPPLYGVFETNARAIKLLARQRELQGRVAGAQTRASQAQHEVAHLTGALDDLDYQLKTWQAEGQINGTDFKRLFGERFARSATDNVAGAATPLGEWNPPASDTHFEGTAFGHKVLEIDEGLDTTASDDAHQHLEI